MVYLIQDSSFFVNIFTEKLAVEMTKAGVSTKFLRLGSNSCVRTCKKIIPSTRLYNVCSSYLNMIITKKQIKKIVKPGDVFIIYESANTISPISDCAVHRAISKRGGKIISLIPDAWHMSYENLKKGILERVKYADIIGGVTPTLVDAFKKQYPNKQICLMEESIDYDAFNFEKQSSESTPIVLWSGPPIKLDEVYVLDSILQKVGLEYNFKLRIVTGESKPNLNLKTNWEWLPYMGTSYDEQFSGASIGFASYETKPYAQCKGNYKIKTYLAAGCAVVTTDIAYNRVLVNCGQNGILASNESEMVEGIKTLLTNYSLREQCRENARKFIFENYSTQATAIKYIKTLKDLNFI